MTLKYEHTQDKLKMSLLIKISLLFLYSECLCLKNVAFFNNIKQEKFI